MSAGEQDMKPNYEYMFLLFCVFVSCMAFSAGVAKRVQDLESRVPPNAAQVERLIIENQKLRSENQRNIKTFEALYIEKGNRFEKHIYESEKNILPDVRGMK